MGIDIRKKYIRRGIRTASRIYNDKTIVILISLGKVGSKIHSLFILENDGTLLWRLLDEIHQVKEIVNAIAKLKKISSARIERQLVIYLKKLAKNHVVDIIDSPVKEYY